MTLVELQEWAYNNLDNYKIIQSGRLSENS